MKRLVAMVLVVTMLLNATCVYAESYYVDDTVPEPVKTETTYEEETVPEPVKTETTYEENTVPEPIKTEFTYVDETPGNLVEDETDYTDDVPDKSANDSSEYEDFEPSTPVKSESTYVYETSGNPVEDKSHYVDETPGEPVSKPTAKPLITPNEEPAEYEDFETSSPVKSESTYDDETLGMPVKDESDYTDDTPRESVRDTTQYEDLEVGTLVETPEPVKEKELEDSTQVCEHDIYLHSNARYAQNNAHSHTWKDITFAFCKKCGEELSREENEYEEKHHFNSSGTCHECGYSKNCNHENERERYLGTSDSEYYNQHYHLAITTTEVYCGNCGETLHENEYEEYLNHVTENGRCTVCDKQLYVIPEIEIDYEEEVTSNETITANTIVLHINDNTGYCDGNQVTWNITPKLQNNKTMVPLKQLMQMVGGEFVEWDAPNKSATFYVNGKYLTYTAGKKKVEGEETPMENSAKIVDNTMYVELTAVVTQAGYKVSFYDNYCVIAKEDLAKEVVHDYATTYYGADFSYKAPQMSSAVIVQLEERIKEFEYILSAIDTAYENGTISKERFKEILDYVKNNCEEYQEVLDGTRSLEDVSEKETKYKAVSGSIGSVVEETQRQLQELGYTSQDITGRYDDTTFNNVLYFQITNGLEATGWLDSATLNAINKREAEVAETKKQTTQEWVEAETPDNSKYIKASLNQIALGNFTEDVTLLGTVGSVALGVLGVDFPMDVRDGIADVVNWEWTWSHVGQTAFDVIALAPAIGALKYTDEVVLLIKNGDKVYTTTKKAGEVAGLVKHADEAADAGKYVDDVVSVTKHVDDLYQSLKRTDAISDDLIEHIFSGQVKKGKAKGFHYEGVGDAKGKVVQVTGAENKYGVYKAKVEVDGVGKTAESTFFPKEWTPQDVVDAIEEAFNGKQLVRNKQFLYEGTCKAGIKIEMYVENGVITTAYPVY